MPHLYRGARGRAGRADVFATDHADPHHGRRFRWLLSTCLAAIVGALAIVVVIYGATDPRDSAGGLMPTLQRLQHTAMAPMPAPSRQNDGLRWAIAKADRLQVTTGAMSTRFIIHETLKQRRNGREYIHAKPYVRILARLAPVPPSYADVIPPFNPVKLYAEPRPSEAMPGSLATSSRSDVSFRVVELLGGFLPGEDGQELAADEVDELVTNAAAEFSAPAATGVVPAPLSGTIAATNQDEPSATNSATLETPPNTTILVKSIQEHEEDDDALEDAEVRVVTVGPGDTLTKILMAAGADTYQVREMLEPAKAIFSEDQLAVGNEVHIALVPSLTDPNQREPVRFSVFSDGHVHRVTVRLNSAGEFVASAEASGEKSALRSALKAGSRDTTSSLYASLYHAALVQSMPTETIQQILRIHAYEADYRRRLRADDSAEFFFDLKQEGGIDGPPGELLYTALSAGGETSRYYRFRTPDGTVDYYDPDGNNSRKFLLRKPVRGDDLRLTSGFGVRFHPLLGVRKMHTGIDWSAPPGTPIIAAGNGTIEEAGRKSAYGNYVRIRHANGYQTAYGHMSRIAPGIEPGVKVRQGQLIGYVGSTGLSSGPHLHYEVLINARFVDPLSIQVPRERKLTGRELAEFHKERARIDELMRRSPVVTASR